jgi:hypothetical protein
MTASITRAEFLKAEERFAVESDEEAARILAGIPPGGLL